MNEIYFIFWNSWKLRINCFLRDSTRESKIKGKNSFQSNEKIKTKKKGSSSGMGFLCCCVYFPRYILWIVTCALRVSGYWFLWRYSQVNEVNEVNGWTVNNGWTDASVTDVRTSVIRLLLLAHTHLYINTVKCHLNSAYHRPNHR